MLPASRRIAALLVGFGIAVIAAGLTIPRVWDFSPKLPLDAQFSTWTLSDPDGTAIAYRDSGPELYHGPLTYQWHLSLLEPADADSVTARIGETLVKADSVAIDDLIRARVWVIPMDRHSGRTLGQASLFYQLATPQAEFDLDGYWFKFPPQPQPEPYDIFVPTLRTTIPAYFAGEEYLGDRLIYRYRQQIDPVPVSDYHEDVALLPPTPAAGQDLELYHSGVREFSVDVATGMLVDLKVTVDDFFADAAGQRVSDVLVFEAETAASDREQFLAQAAGLSRQRTGEIIQNIGVYAGSALLIIGLWGVLVGYSRRAR